ncbi:MAG: YfhO family protein [Candidatus Andersenbacteria bacterium]|nr:YfhO family protein [Candidatus Andersenbacteria bacterium]
MITRSPVFWLIIVVLAAQYPLLGGQFFSSGDIRDVFVPLEYFFHHELLAGRLPAWHPNIAWGFPVIASAQIGFFYPPLLILRLLPLPLYLTFLVLMHLIGLALGMYFFLRALGRSEPAAYFGSISFTLGSFIIQHLTHLNILITAAWLPWQLLAVHRAAARDSLRARDLVQLAVLLALPFLAGQMHVPVLLALVSASYFIFVRLIGRRSLTRSLAALLTVAALVVLLGAVQLIPTAELVIQSSRGPAGDFNLKTANQHSFPIYHLPSILWPRFFGHDHTYWGKRLQIEYGIFIGTIPLLFSIFALLRRLRSPDAFFRCLLAVSFLLSLGSISPFRLIGLEPSLWIFSAPARWLLFTTFAFSYFAAQGLDMMLSRRGKSLAKTAARAAIAVSVTVAVSNAFLFTIDQAAFTKLADAIFWGSRELPEAYYTDKLGQLLNSARSTSVSVVSPYTTLPLILLAALPPLISRRFGTQIILAAATAELIIIAATANPTIAWKNILTPPASVAGLPPIVSTGQARLLSLPTPGDTGLYFTNPDSRVSPDERTAHYQLLPPLTHALFSIPGVEWPASLTLNGHVQKLDAIRDAAAGALSSPAQAEQANIGAVLVRAAGEIRLSRLTPQPRASGAARIQYLTLKPAHTRLIIAASSATTVTIRDSYYPGWRAYLDGQRIPIQRAEEIFRRVAIPTGIHTVDLLFRPQSLYIGLTITATVAVACSLLLLKPALA